MDNFLFADRTQWELGNNAITQTAQMLKSDHVPILDLTESNPSRCQFKWPKRRILKALQNKENLNYQPDAHGLKHARTSVADYFGKLGFCFNEEQVFLTASTSEVYSYLFRLLANPKDTILFPQPSYPLFSFLGDLHDVELKYYQLNYETQWRIDFSSLEEQIDATTKAVCLVNPNNPTGSYIKKDELEQLQALCQKYDLAIICDEVFWEFSLDEEQHVSLFESTDQLTFILGGLSKTLGLPQMKLSWLVVQGPQDWRQQAISRLEVIADTYLSVNTPAQNALNQWLSLSHQMRGVIQKRIQENLAVLKAQMEGMTSCTLLKVEGGWYAILKVPPVRTEEEWVLKLLTKYHVLVHPGYFYDFVDEPYLVLSLLPSPAVFKEGVGRILARIEQQYVNA